MKSKASLTSNKALVISQSEKLSALFAGFFFLMSASVSAQKITTHESMYWLRYYNQWTLNKNLIWHNEVDNRRLFDNGIQNQVIAHSHLHYKWSNWEPAVGMTFSWQHSYNSTSEHTLTVPEIRPFQEINHRTKLSSKLSVQQRIRLDERFIHNTQAGELTDGYTFVFRARYRIFITYQLNEKIALKANDELFVNTKGLWFEQNRIYAGIEYSFSKKLGSEIGYMYLHQQRKESLFTDRNIVRLTIYHRIGQ